MNFLKSHKSWEIAEETWDKEAFKLNKASPLKTIKHIPQNSPIFKANSALKIKGLLHILKNDKKKHLLTFFLKKPLIYLLRLLSSYLKKRSFFQKNDYFLFGIETLDQFKKILLSKETILILGFSYCQRPYECPSLRFSDNCLHDPENSICRQCFIGKCFNFSNLQKVMPLLIPDVNYIGKKIFELQKSYPTKRFVFLITSCSLAFNIFSDFANMVKVKGLGVRIIGRECFNFKAFQLSEKGIKPGMTIIPLKEQKFILELLKICKNF